MKKLMIIFFSLFIVTNLNVVPLDVKANCESFRDVFNDCIRERSYDSARIAVCTEQAANSCQGTSLQPKVDPQTGSKAFGSCNNIYDCNDGNLCTLDSCDDGVCRNVAAAAGTICALDEYTGSPSTACNANKSCNQPIYNPGPLRIGAPTVPVQPSPVQPIFGPVSPPAIRPVPGSTQPEAPEDAPQPEASEPDFTPAEPGTTQPPGQIPRRPAAPRTPVQIPGRGIDSPNPPSCPFGGQNFAPGQKRYECFEPREQGSCGSDTGYGIPFICNSDGDWSVGNKGFGECTTACLASSSSSSQPPSQSETAPPPYTPGRRTPSVTQIPGVRPSQTTPQPAICPQSGDTCIYSTEGGQCYSGTGTYGFNAPKCVYSCGPVECPVISEEPRESAQTPQNDTCFGEIYSSCGSEDNNMVMTSWLITSKLGQESCNVFIRDELGDHKISSDCSGVWSGTEVPGGTKVTKDGSYELYVSNGTDSCFNQLAAKIQLACQEKDNEQQQQFQQQNENNSIIEPVIDWISGLINSAEIENGQSD